MGVRENKVETHLDEQITSVLKGTTRKWVGRKNLPDRMCMAPVIGMFAVEVKTVDGTESEGQARERKRLIEAGGTVYIVYGNRDVDMLIDVLRAKQAGANVEAVHSAKYK